MRENEFSIIGKGAVALGLVMLAAAVSANLAEGRAPNPSAFVITLVGFGLLVVAKVSVIRRGPLVSFGPGLMRPGMKNAYRAGWWLMVVGVMATFGP